VGLLKIARFIHFFEDSLSHGSVGLGIWDGSSKQALEYFPAASGKCGNMYLDFGVTH
jgi:hypothetical protein